MCGLKLCREVNGCSWLFEVQISKQMSVRLSSRKPVSGWTYIKRPIMGSEQGYCIRQRMDAFGSLSSYVIFYCKECPECLEKAGRAIGSDWTRKSS